jgi:hypothetical protein
LSDEEAKSGAKKKIAPEKGDIIKKSNSQKRWAYLLALQSATVSKPALDRHIHQRVH